MSKTQRLYIFGWPGAVGGASTKLAHLLRLLSGRFSIVVVPNEPSEVDETWVEFLRALEARWCLFEELPQRLEGWGLSLCNFEFLLGRRWAEARARGLKMAWSNEMMWTHPGELGAIFAGLVDQVLYVSEVQRDSLEPAFWKAWTGSLAPWSRAQKSPTLTGEIKSRSSTLGLRWAITGNYIDPELFPPREPRLKAPDEPLVIGRLSRSDPAKFPANFPAFYENLGVRNAKFRVMAWSAELAARWKGHAFDDRWDLLPVLQQDSPAFLRSLDLFVYSLSGEVCESWGRCVAEAMLSGAVPILPDAPEHHLRNLVKHGESGFLCRSEAEFGEYARLLDKDRELLRHCSENARADAVNRLCVAAEHLRFWEAAFPECYCGRS
jgi:glycosyltransferase involved in cell wall biosynthesis